jgi:hypothetical protein
MTWRSIAKRRNVSAVMRQRVPWCSLEVSARGSLLDVLVVSKIVDSIELFASCAVRLLSSDASRCTHGRRE